MQKERYIVHVDMDAFFASIEQRDDPSLRGRPVIVGADPKGGKGRGVVSTCSYEARRYGIHSAMPISEAWRMCPHGVYLAVDMERYEEVSRRIYRILYDFTPDIEPVSIDEAYLDITGSWHLFGAPLETCRLIKARIKEKTDLSASVGLAPTKMAAKIASDLKKPDGLVEVRREELRAFLDPLSIRKIPGLGEKTEKALNGMGIRTIGELAKMDEREAARLFGKNGEELRRLSGGIDDRPVETGSGTKSVSGEMTFEKDTDDEERIRAGLVSLCERVSDRLRRDGLRGRTVTLKIRLEGFKTYTRSSTADQATNFIEAISAEIKTLYGNFDRKRKRVRLVGVKVSGLVPADIKESLFDDAHDRKKEKVHQAVDRLKAKFGNDAIYRAGGRLI